MTDHFTERKSKQLKERSHSVRNIKPAKQAKSSEYYGGTIKANDSNTLVSKESKEYNKMQYQFSNQKSLSKNLNDHSDYIKNLYKKYLGKENQIQSEKKPKMEPKSTKNTFAKEQYRESSKVCTRLFQQPSLITNKSSRMYDQVATQSSKKEYIDSNFTEGNHNRSKSKQNLVAQISKSKKKSKQSIESSLTQSYKQMLNYDMLNMMGDPRNGLVRQNDQKQGLLNEQIIYKAMKILDSYKVILMNSYHYLFKFIVIGDTGVGKSCIVLQFIENKTRNTHDVTIGVEFGAKTLPINEKMIKLQIWDTAGQQNFRSITRSYYRSAIGSLLVYDITRRDTFTHVKNWLQEVKSNGNPHMQILLVGNKNDLEEQRVISYQEGQKMAQENGISFIEINSKDYQKVEEAFKKIASSILIKVENERLPLSQGIGVKAGDQPLVKDQLKSSKSKDKNSKCC